MLVAVVLAATGCSSDDDGTATTDTTAPASTSTSQVTTTTSAVPTSPPSTAAPSTTTTEATDGPVELRFDGVGPAEVGMPADEAVAALTGALGATTELRPWTQPSCELAGPDSDGARSAVWDGLVVTFRGASESEAVLAGWTYLGGPAGSAEVLALPTGVTVGDSGNDLSSAYGSAATFQSFEMFDPHWEVSHSGTVLWATVGSDAPGAPITRMDLQPQVCE